MKVSVRGSSVAPFHVMEVLKAANHQEGAGQDVKHMEVGEPGGGAPARVIEAANEALRSSHIKYTEALGIPELRNRISKYYEQIHKVTINPERIIITTGSSGAFLLGFLAAFDPGDKVVVTTPGYPAYPNILKSIGLLPVTLPTGPQSRFQPTPAALSEVGTGVEGLIIASPANPTGTMLDFKALRSLANYCNAQGIRLISDEVYHGITYGHNSVSAVEVTDSAIVVNSFSKYYSMTGWRLGWMVVPQELIRSIEVLAQNLAISAPTLSQHAAISAFDSTQELNQKVAGYAKNRELLSNELPAIGFEMLAPVDGAFYIFCDVGHLTENSTIFCQEILEKTGVAITPGVDFDPDRGHRHVRFSFAGDHDDIVQAIARLRSFLT